MDQLYFKSAIDWQLWLEKNHAIENGIWLIFYKKETKHISIAYEDAVNIALCFGWIDSIIKKIDGERYVRKFNPRRDKSQWSESNKKRVAQLMKAGLMREAGLAKIEMAKKNGSWLKQEKPEVDFTMPSELEKALTINPEAQAFFERLTNSNKKQYILWINMAKRSATREKRIKEAITLMGNKKKLGLK